MSEIKKNFSDFQENECDSIPAADQVSPPIEQELCPTCVKDPTFKLKQNWYDIEEPYLHAGVCEYRVRIYVNEAPETYEGQKQQWADGFQLEDIYPYAIRKILIQFKKLINTQIVEELQLVTRIVKVIPTNTTFGDALLISIPAFNFDRVPQDDSLPKSKTPQEAALSAPDIIIDIETFNLDWTFLKAALETYGFFYRAAQHVDNLLIVEQDNQTNRIDYEDAVERCEEFQETLNALLTDSGYSDTELFYNLFAKRAKKIKIVFNNEDDLPFGVQSVLALEANGCQEYVELEGFEDLNDPKFNIVYNFLTNLTAIMRDITGQDTKPWLEFTLDHFYPQMVVDYGLMSGEYDEQQKDALSCLLDAELGLDGGLLDSVANEIMSFMDTVANEIQKEACRAIDTLFEGTPGFDADKRRAAEQKRAEEEKKKRKARVLQKFQKEFTSKIENIIRKDFEKVYEFQQNQNLYDGIQSYIDTPTFDERAVEVRFNTDFDSPITQGTSRGFGHVYHFSTEPPGYRANQIAVQVKQHAIMLAAAKYEFEYPDDKGLPSPYELDYLKAKEERLQLDNTFISFSKKKVSPNKKKKPSKKTMGELISSIGLCGINKMVGKYFKCLLGGIEIDDLNKALVDALFDNLRIDFFALLLAELPADMTNRINNKIAEQFQGASLSDLINLKLSENPRATLGDLLKTTKIANEVMAIYERTPSEQIGPNGANLQASAPDDFEVLQNALNNRIEDIAILYRDNYDYKNKVYIALDPADPKGSSKVKGQIKAAIKNFIKNGKRLDVEEGLARINNALKPLPPQEPLPELSPEERAEDEREINRLQQEAEQERNARIEANTTVQSATIIENLVSDNPLREGDSGSTVKELQELLERRGYDIGPNGADGIYGSDTRAAVEKYQTDNNLSVDGVAGIETFTDLHNEEIFGELLDDDLENIQENLENEIELISERRRQERQEAQADADSARALEEEERLLEIARARGNLRQIEADQAAAEREAKRKAKYITSQSEYDKAVNSFKKSINPLGVALDAVYDVIFDIVVDEIKALVGIDALFKILKTYPGAGIIFSVLDSTFKKCPTPPLFYPPIDDFMKSFSLDVCDPTFTLHFPKVVVPNINWTYKFTEFFKSALSDAIDKLIYSLLDRLVIGSLNSLEGLICKSLESIGGFVASAAQGNYDGDALMDALDEAFCKGETDENGVAKAEKLANELIGGLFGRGVTSDDVTGVSSRAVNVISGVSSKDEILSAFVASNEERNERFEIRAAEAIRLFVPELAAVLGSPSQIGKFFRNLGSYLSPDDKNRIRNLLASGVPNLPISSAVCLTNEQLDEWNKLREDLLRQNGLSQEDARARVNSLNDATLEALEDLLGDIGDLNRPEGPFYGPILEILQNPENSNRRQMPEGSTIDDIYDNTESCSDNLNPLNAMRSPTQKQFEDQLTDAQFDNFESTLANLFRGPGGILGEALRDTNDSNIFFHSLAVFFSFVFPTLTKYVNSTVEYDGPRETSGQFPITVAIKLREEIFEKISVDLEGSDTFQTISSTPEAPLFIDEILCETEALNIAASKNIKYAFQVGEGFNSFYYDVSATQNNFDVGTFNYRINVQENLGSSVFPQAPTTFTVPVGVTPELIEYMNFIGFNYGSDEPSNIRLEIFKKLLQFKNPDLEVDYDEMYELLLATFNQQVVQAILTNPDQLNGIPLGFQFGYTSDGLSIEDFNYQNPNGGDYDKQEEEKILGKFGNDRIVALNPEIYGGSYTNPPITILPRQFTGWYDVKDRIFSKDGKGEYGEEGCDDRTPALLEFNDIKKRVKKLDEELREDPRLAENPDCADVRPFSVLLNKKNIANLDGLVRTTLRTYIVEHFLRSFGLMTNLEFSDENYDFGFTSYVIEIMKSEMIELFIIPPIFTGSIAIVQSRYWYTFLEQCVQTYNRMIEVDGLVPPPEVKTALKEISDAVDLYEYPTDSIRKNHLDENIEFTLPGQVPNVKDAVQDPDTFYRHAMAYRLYGENIFNSTDSFKLTNPWSYSLKKIRFFSKIYFIRLLEEQAKVVMSELMKAEFRRISKNYSASPFTKPYIFDLKRHIFGMTTLFEGTSSRLGLRQYYIDKQQGKIDTGTVPDRKSLDELDDFASSDGPKLLLEKYINVVDKPDQTNVPEFIANRDGLRGKTNITEFADFISEYSSGLTNEKISDCFGDLRFIYSMTLQQIFDAEFTDDASIAEIKSMNPTVFGEFIDESLNEYYLFQSAPDFPLNVPERMAPIGATPIGTRGNIGISFGLSISIVDMVDGEAVRINLLSTEVDVIDQELASFNPISGEQSFDLECMVNKMVALDEFDLFFEKIMGLKSIPSMTAVYCSHGFTESLGQGTGERAEVEEPQPDEWDGTYNFFAKDILRRQFAGYYLSNDIDGAFQESGDEFARLSELLNPFNGFKISIGLDLKIPRWRIKNIKKRVYNKNGEECSSPLKDLQ